MYQAFTYHKRHLGMCILRSKDKLNGIFLATGPLLFDSEGRMISCRWFAHGFFDGDTELEGAFELLNRGTCLANDSAHHTLGDGQGNALWSFDLYDACDSQELLYLGFECLTRISGYHIGGSSGSSRSTDRHHHRIVSIGVELIEWLLGEHIVHDHHRTS